MKPNLDMDEDVDLAVLWQRLKDRPHEELSQQQAAWMDRHGIADLKGLNAYRDARLRRHNEPLMMKGLPLFAEAV